MTPISDFVLAQAAETGLRLTPAETHALAGELLAARAVISATRLGYAPSSPRVQTSLAEYDRRYGDAPEGSALELAGLRRA